MRNSTRTVATIAWTSFMAACLLEALVFAVVDPGSFQGMGSALEHLSAPALHTLGFGVFWACTAVACTVCTWLQAPLRSSFEDHASPAS